jgi:hypothetical protein
MAIGLGGGSRFRAKHRSVRGCSEEGVGHDIWKAYITSSGFPPITWTLDVVGAELAISIL